MENRWLMVNSYHLVMTFTVRHGFSMALIEIDGLPFLIAWVDLSMANCECHNQMVPAMTGNGKLKSHQPGRWFTY